MSVKKCITNKEKIIFVKFPLLLFKLEIFFFSMSGINTHCLGNFDIYHIFVQLLLTPLQGVLYTI